MKLVWRSRHATSPSIITSASNSSPPSTAASNVNLNEKTTRSSVTVPDAAIVTAALAEKEASATAPAPASPPKKKSWGWKLSSKKSPPASSDPEKSASQARPIRLFAPIYGGLGLGLSVCESRARPFVALSCLTSLFQSLWAAVPLCCFKNGDWMETSNASLYSPLPHSLSVSHW